MRAGIRAPNHTYSFHSSGSLCSNREPLQQYCLSISVCLAFGARRTLSQAIELSLSLNTRLWKGNSAGRVHAYPRIHLLYLSRSLITNACVSQFNSQTISSIHKYVASTISNIRLLETCLNAVSEQNRKVWKKLH